LSLIKHFPTRRRLLIRRRRVRSWLPLGGHQFEVSAEAGARLALPPWPGILDWL